MSQEASSKQEYSEPALFYRLGMSAPDPDTEGELAHLQVGLDGETPVLQVWPASQAQAKKGPIKARMNTTAFGNELANLLEMIADAEPSTKGIIGIEANRRVDGQLVRKVVTQVMVGKRADGVMVIALFDAVDDTRPRILFPFLGADWIKPAEINNVPVSDAIRSCATARFYAKFFRRMVYDSALKETTQQRKARMDAIRARRDERDAAFKANGYKPPEGSRRPADEMVL